MDYGHFNRPWSVYALFGPRLEPYLDRLLQIQPSGIRLFDIGCGTGRAAAEIEAKSGGKITALGSTLTRMPPWPGYPSLDPERIRIAHAGNLRLPPESQDLILAVGSLEFSHDFTGNIPRILNVLSRNGLFFLAEVTNETGQPYDAARYAYQCLSQHYRIVSEPAYPWQSRLFPVQATYFCRQNADPTVLNLFSERTPETIVF